MVTQSRARLSASNLRMCLRTLLVWYGFTGTAHAAPELVLSWPSLPACPEAAAVQDRVRERLGRALDDRAIDPLHASAVILIQERGLTLTLHLRQADRDAVRELSAANCGDLAEAAALVLALAIDPTATPEAKAQLPDPAPESRANPAEVGKTRASEDAPPTPASPPPRAPRPRPLHASVGLLLDVGSLPGASAGPVAAIGYQLHGFRAELAGIWLPSRASSGQVGAVSVSLWALIPSACTDLLGSKAVLSACVALEMGRAVGRGRKLQQSVRAGSLHTAGSLGLRLTLPLDASTALVGESGALVPFQRTRFVSVDTNAADPAPLHESAALALRARLSLELRF
jgi:hypothetical protein